MLNGTVRTAGWVALMVSMSMAGGCDSGAASRDHQWPEGEMPPLRAKHDPARDRAWALTLSGVDLYEFKTRRMIRHIALPGWSWVGEPYGCAPDLAIGPNGEALISSDVQPTLWRVHPGTLEVTRHVLVLDQDQDKDAGFSHLAYSAKHGAFVAVSSFYGSRWMIDASLKTARKIQDTKGQPKCAS